MPNRGCQWPGSIVAPFRVVRDAGMQLVAENVLKLVRGDRSDGPLPVPGS